LFNLTNKNSRLASAIFVLQLTNILPDKGHNPKSRYPCADTILGGRNQNYRSLIKKNIVSVRNRTSKRAAAKIAASLFTNTMKKFIIFILILLLLIVSEYYFLTEIFTQRRLMVIAPSCLLIVLCLFGLVRFLKRSVISS
jgi:hypothetical protein